MSGSELRLAEPLAALSVATDLARGRPPEQALHACIIATKLAEHLGLTLPECATTFFASMLRFAGCTATSHEYSRYLGGNDVAVRFGGDGIDPVNPEDLGALLTALGASPADAPQVIQVVVEGSRADCEVGARLALRLGLSQDVADSLLHIFERWDGHGFPHGVSGESIPFAARIGAVANTAVMFAESAGPSGALETIQKWSGSILDPSITSSFLVHSDELLSTLEIPDVWQAALAEEPLPWKTVEETKVDDICEAFGNFIDLKTPFLHGHSARVSRLAEGAASSLNMSEADCILLRRAGFLHDLGRAGISSGIWEKAAPLSTLDLEQARLHPYHSEKILERSSLFQPLARLVGEHHERTDGSGYFRGLSAASLSQHSRILAAADACAELLEDRPGREALVPDAAAKALSREPLDPDALQAVLKVAGVTKTEVTRKRPAGLTPRELEVLRLLARGLSLRQIADQLIISESTAHTHAAHVYEKAGISTRAGAALFAMEHGLL